MTGLSSDEAGAHFVIHHDAGDDGPGAPPEAPEEVPEPRPSLLQRYRYWLYVAVLAGLFCAAAYVIGDAVYNPPSRLPQLDFATVAPLYGTNGDVAAELDSVRETFADQASLDLEPTGTVFRLPLPRTFGDRLFGERDEAATVFVAGSSVGEFRFLELSGDGGERIFAIEAPFGLSRSDQPTGVFLALDPADPVLGPLVSALDAMRPAVDDLPHVNVSPDGLYVFGPYDHGDSTGLRALIEGNAVMTYLTGAIDASNGSVSLAAPVIMVSGGPARGTINAIYQPARRVILAPLWGGAPTAVLAHELTHAYLDTVVADKQPLLSQAADYLEQAHPVLHGKVVGDLYERLGREGRAEESLAFITGAIAAKQTKTVSTQQLLENTGNLKVSEAILYSDVRLLVQFGLLPSCMLPDEGAQGAIKQSFYDEVALICG